MNYLVMAILSPALNNNSNHFYSLGDPPSSNAVEQDPEVEKPVSILFTFAPGRNA